MSDSSDEEREKGEEVASSSDSNANIPKCTLKKPKITVSSVDEVIAESRPKRSRVEEDSDEKANEEPQQKVKRFGASDPL